MKNTLTAFDANHVATDLEVTTIRGDRYLMIVEQTKLMHDDDRDGKKNTK